MKQSTKELIATFAKSNKVSKEKLEKLVKAALVTQNATKAKKDKTVRVCTRKHSELHEHIKNDIVTLKQFTTRDLMAKYNTDRFHVNPVLYSLEKQGLVTRTVAKNLAHKGRAPNMWMTK